MGMRISSSSNSAQGAGSTGAAAWQQRQQSFKALSEALQSNDLGAAKAAYAQLTSGGNKSAGSTNSPLAQLGAALQSGDLSGAQQAFASMRSKHHTQGSESSAAASTAAPAPSRSTLSTGSLLNVVA